MRIGKYWILKPYEAFGNRAEDIYFALLKCRRDGQKLILIKRKLELFWKFRFRQANSSLLEITHPLIVTGIMFELLNWLVTLALSFIRIIGMMLHNFEKRIGFSGIGMWLVSLSEINFGHFGLWGCTSSPFNKNNLEINWDECFKQKIGIKYKNKTVLRERFPGLDERKYVCLHVRDGGFWRDAKLSRNRNADVNSYLPAINLLVANGYVVVRLGDPSMPPLKLDGVFDYANSSERSSSNDILLIEYCDFYVGSQSGPIDTAAMFEKKILTVNTLSLAHSFWYREGSLFIPKAVYKKGKRLSLCEQIDEEIFEIDGTGKETPGYEFVENTPEEILKAVKEFLLNKKLNKNQIRFNDFLNTRLLSHFEQRKLCKNAVGDTNQKNRWSSRLTSNGGGVCDFYLKKNWR